MPIVETKFKKIFDLSPDPILILKSGRFIYCNQAAVTAMGYKSDRQLLQLKPSELSPQKQPDGISSLEKVEKILADVHNSGVERFDWLHQKSDGSDLYVEVTLTRIEVDEEEFFYVQWKDLGGIRELEFELEESRRRFIEVANSSSDWVWEVDKNDRYTFVSPKVEEFLGYKPEEMIGELSLKTMSEEESLRVNEIFTQYTSKQLPFKDIENVNIHKDGHSVILQTSGVPIYDIHGEFAGYRGSDRDITNIKNLLSSLKESQENLKEAQKLANIGHWELNLVDNSLYWSDEVYRIFGLEPQEFGATYESFLKHIHPDDHDLVNNAYRDSVVSKSSYYIVHRVLTKQNELKYVEERCSHKIDAQGNVVKSIGTVHDITQRVIHEKELELASNVFKYSTESIVITDADNKIISINSAYEKLTQYSLEELVGKDPRILSSGWGDNTFYEKMWQEIVTQGLWQGEIWDRKKDGTLYAAYQSIIAVRDKEGKIINYIAIAHDVTDAKNREKIIRELAYYDFLTKLPNRKLFEQEVDTYIKSSHYNDKKFAILFLDLDNFKWVNDSLGHRFGDKVLVEVSQRISRTLPEDAIFSRLGGDEFVLLIPYEDTLNISQFATVIIDSVKDTIMMDKKEINVGWSIGISLFPENGTTYSLLLQNADIAMYDAKAKGKNNFKFFADAMNLFAQERLAIDTRLRYAVSNSLFTLNYQPKLSCREKKIKGFEALIRWNDEQLGIVSPDKFIPIAEESGYIYEIGLWVAREALKALKIIHKVNDETTMAINISGKQLENSYFFNDIKKIIEDSSVDARKLEFEITETSIMKDIEHIIPVLEKIKELGIQISIDDFGTGYSSMAYLKKLPIDTLKIDKAFINDIEYDEEDKAIVEAIIALSGALKLSTVAEGVENLTQQNMLESMGCDVYQGYFYSKPLSLDDLLEFIN